MRSSSNISAILILATTVPFSLFAQTQNHGQLHLRNVLLLRDIQLTHHLDENRMEKVRAIFNRSTYIGQGNPAITKHPVSREECREKLKSGNVSFESAVHEKICGAPYMAPLYDPVNEQPEQARACIDKFEFPNIPCEYPLVWVRAKEAAEICTAMGKRLCDAHEWEGACEGRLLQPDYRFDLAKGKSASSAVGAMAQAHNQTWGRNKTWVYGTDGYRKGVCGGASRKDKECQGGQWATCGSNTYPSGCFTSCRSSLGVYDMHGNAAEHMNLPLDESQMASRGSTTLGHTEMKGSWFIFDTYYAHQDWCRWRAPYWHGSRVMDENSHRNYHLGFRCCKTIRRDAEDRRLHNR